jgi:hypothetical protein
MYSAICGRDYDGFLVVYGKEEIQPDGTKETIAHSVFCSNRKKNGSVGFSCNSNYKFSIYDNKCRCCHLPIEKDEIIGINTHSSDDKAIWTHFDCMKLEPLPEFKLERCMKCLNIFHPYEEKVPATIDRRKGFKHVSCPTISSPHSFKRSRKLIMDDSPNSQSSNNSFPAVFPPLPDYPRPNDLVQNGMNVTFSNTMITGSIII